MIKILQIVDTYDWAIGTLAKGIIKHNGHFAWTRMAVHPKDLEQGKVDLAPIIAAVRDADIVDAQYWRTISQLIDLIPELRSKVVIMTHHNEKNLLSYDWPANVIHVAKTKYSEETLRAAYPNARIAYIPNCFDEDEFEFNAAYPPEEPMVGYVGRICSWKGLKNLAQACYELKYPLMVMGKYDKMDYFESIPFEHRENIRWDYFNCDNEERRDFYREITCYVGNSGGGREVGTLGFIEALACGVPVISTPAGLAADIHDDENENFVMVDYDDLNGLKEAISRVMESPALQSDLRRNGWNTIRNFNTERMALQYRELFNSIIYTRDLISVIIPTTPDKADQTAEILKALEAQTYPDWEAVVVFDQAKSDPRVQSFREAVKRDMGHAVKVIETSTVGGYNLAMARNMGLLEADGKYVMLCDNRLKPDPDAMMEMLTAILKREKKAKVWVFGEKGGEKSTFVENFSMISKRNLVDGGMFFERVNDYGGMSQELRERFSHQGFEFGYVPTARAEQIVKSSLSPAKRKGIIRMKNLLYRLGQN